jgi:PAS domain-containing protein
MDFEQPHTIIGPRYLNIRRSDEDSPAKAEWVSLCWTNPQAARRERRRQRIEAAQKRVAEIEARLRKAEGKRKKWREVAATVAALRRDLAVAQAELEAADMEEKNLGLRD